MTKTEKQCRELVKERSGGRCERCGWMVGQSIHHRRKRSQGGPWSPSNCVHLCGDGTVGCHGWIEAHPNAAAAAGWHVRSWQDEALVPIVGIHGIVLLDDQGGVVDQEVPF